MTKTLDKTELVRLAWLTELRRQGHRQCHQPNLGIFGKQVCALQLLAEIVDPHGEVDGGSPSRWGHPKIARAAGLDHDQLTAVYQMNDGTGPKAQHQHTFAEIADVVEGWFK